METTSGELTFWRRRAWSIGLVAARWPMTLLLRRRPGSFLASSSTRCCDGSPQPAAGGPGRRAGRSSITSTFLGDPHGREVIGLTFLLAIGATFFSVLLSVPCR